LAEGEGGFARGFCGGFGAEGGAFFGGDGLAVLLVYGAVLGKVTMGETDHSVCVCVVVLRGLEIRGW
jgi:hypothetical protein